MRILYRIKKTRGRALLLAALLALPLGACGKAAESSVPPAQQAPAVSSPEQTVDPQISPELRAQALLETLTTEQKAGQLFVVNINGTELDDAARRYLKDANVGNVILFGNNSTDADTLAALNRQIQEEIAGNTGVAAFIGIDQEGGDITRIRSGATWFPGAMAFGASGSDTFTAGQYMGRELRAIGINFNFAPDSDINSNPDNPVINTRAYGDTAQRVAGCASAMARGLQDGGVVSAVKHFPGHGDTSTDSHYGLPMIDKTPEALEALELVPFKAAIADGAEAVMSAHIMFPQLDKTYPATMSKAVLTGLLREKLGFEGLIITDSLRMGAIQDYFGMSNACVKAVQAGADLLLTGGGGGDLPAQQAAYEAVLQAVNSGAITAERLDESVLRILTVKARYGILDDPYPAEDLAARDWTEHYEFAESAALASITLTRDRDKLLPLERGERVLFISTIASVPLTEGAKVKAQENSVAYLLAQAWGDGGDWLAVPRELGGSAAREAARRAAGCDKVVLACRSAAVSEGQTALIRAVAQANPRLILVAMGSPYDTFVFERQAGTALCAYDYTPPSARAVVKVVADGAQAMGTLPIKG